MLRIIIGVFLLLQISSNSLAQAIFLDSTRTAISISAGIVASENTFGSGFGANIALGGKGNIALSFANNSISSDFNESKSNTSGVGITVGYMALNELHANDLFGFEFGLIHQNIRYENFSSRKVLQFGVNLELSKKFVSETNKSVIVGRLGFVGIPVILVEGDEQYDNYLAGESYGIISPSIALLFDITDKSKFILEPGLAFNTEDSRAFFSLATYLLF